jgi:hypothetical protein
LTGPSIKRDGGRIKRKPRMVSTANILAGVRFSPRGLPSRIFFERIALVAEVTALIVPAKKLSHVKESSYNI